MNSFLHKTIAVTLATLVLFTTMSFTVDMHYCGDALVDFSVVHNAKTCGMEKQESENDCHSVIQDDSCCSDKQVVVEGQDDLKISFDTLTFEQQVFVASFSILILISSMFLILTSFLLEIINLPFSYGIYKSYTRPI